MKVIKTSKWEQEKLDLKAHIKENFETQDEPP